MGRSLRAYRPKIANGIVRVPWSISQIESLSDYQEAQSCKPYTCDRCPDTPPLLAFHKGLKCDTCGAWQRWAEDFTLDWSWVDKIVTKR